MTNNQKHLDIQCCLLDLGGVVFQSTGQSNETIDWSIISQLNQQYGHQLNLGADVFEEFIRQYQQKTQVFIDGQEFLKQVFDTLDFNHSLVDRLGQNFPICILSDNYRENITYISQRYQFSEWSARQFYSYEYGITKSDPALFRTVLAALKLMPSQVLFIDDYAPHIQTAAKLGIRGIQFANNEQVFDALMSMMD
ncbi:MAG: HAD-IA family hydrolase [Bacteroidota bacterium]